MLNVTESFVNDSRKLFICLGKISLCRSLFIRIIAVSALLLSSSAYSGPWQDMSIAWTHNPDQPLGQGSDHPKAYVKDTALLASGSDESFVSIGI